LAGDYPFLNRFKIPILGSGIILNEVLNEITKLLNRKGSIELTLPNSKQRLLLPIPMEIARSTLRKFNATIHRAIAWTYGDSKSGDSRDELLVAKSLSNMLCTEYKDGFLEVAMENGLSTNNSKKMDPVFWTAMSEDCNFDISTQRQLNMYLKYHFGTRVTAPETLIREVGNDYIPFTTFEKKRFMGKGYYIHFVTLTQC
jgi:hypothetical protein